jgi:hypothetical protein
MARSVHGVPQQRVHKVGVDAGGVGQVHCVLLNLEQLVHHGLVCPLAKQGGHRVLSPVQDQDQWDAVSPGPKLKQLPLQADDLTQASAKGLVCVCGTGGAEEGGGGRAWAQTRA